ncbi:Sulfotransferase family protein [Loktanella atrilutea]|uniref:Sulfotransferase family protein n=1 Tax=Loktanella atrilutea TaxID=366533 RepID=A0A1M5AXH4_LOKAT|nr:sulfotransferase family 2 domain-containing protein [Loktanella atrilutea]SHF34974.1 Sulfotransferase family protein [Loktanella atrilutea]
MILSPGRRYAFVHIPKTGGTALTLALESRAMKDDILIGDTPKARRRRGRLAALQAPGRLWKHSRLRDVEGVCDMTGWRIVTLVRNPWDRIVSYYHWLRVQTFAHPAVTLAQTRDFGAFLNHPQTRASLAAQPYASYLTDAAGTLRATDFIRLEAFATDAAPFFAHLGFRFDLPRANASTRTRDWRGYYTDADAALVARICAADIARSGYRFDPDPVS